MPHLSVRERGALLSHSLATPGLTHISTGLAQGRCGVKIDRNKLRNAPFRHGDAVKPVHSGHRHPVMRNDQETSEAAFGHLIQKRAKAINIRIVQGRINFIQHAGLVVRQKRNQPSAGALNALRPPTAQALRQKRKP